ncbi:MAG: hypothetical protein LBJ31_04635 [Treponema sp.]|jgi:hypothetical protein|nr:hypothetical protein [Treponema sp.]
MDLKAIYGTKLAGVLEKYRSKNEPLAEKGFLLFENLEESALLFLGINPSEVTDTEKYSIKNKNGIYWAKETFKNEYPFYRPFKDLACGMKWSHLDAFFSCEKHQGVLKTMKDSEFLKEQFTISTEIIQKLGPKIIVVGNAHASDLIQKDFGCTFDDKIGTYRIKKFNNVPIFFSGMITGSRALDIGSRERLKWHIKFVKEKHGI